MHASCKLLVHNARQSIEKSLGKHLIGVESILLLDYPDHSNVGDSAIYIGEINYLYEKTGLLPIFVSTCHSNNWDDLDSFDKNTPIFLHGGGNFGDIWPIHQTFREEILRRYPKRLVVQMPQSIHFSNSSKISETARIIKNHGNFILLVRDNESYDFAKIHFDCEVELCADMAFFLKIYERHDFREKSPLFLMRTDKESKQNFINDTFINSIGGIRTDWLEDPRALHAKSALMAITKNMTKFNKSKHAYRAEYFKQKATIRVCNGLDIVNKSGFIITDRLHVHILSVLRNIPHVVIDNSYNKLSRFINCWTHDYEGLQIFSNFNDVKEWCLSMRYKI